MRKKFCKNVAKILSSQKILFLIILLLSLFFRLYNLNNLQYWSADEALGAQVVVDMINSHKITLVGSNTSANFQLGSYYYILSLPVFYFSHLNPIVIGVFMSLIGAINSVLILWGAKIIGGLKFAFIAAFLHASSFLMGLYDRRWWQLSLNPILAAIAIISLYQIIVHKKYLFSLPLAVAISFTAHADLTIAVIGLTTITAFILFKPKIMRKEFIPALIVLFISVLPFIINLRQSFQPKSAAVLNPPENHLNGNTALNKIDIPLAAFSRLLFPQTTNFAENYFCYCAQSDYVEPLFQPFARIVVTIILAFPLYHLIFKKKNPKRVFLALAYINLCIFFIGAILVTLIFKITIHAHYFTIVFPIFFLLAAYSVSKLNNYLIVLVISLYFLINANALLFSTFRYPLSQKIKLVSILSDKIGTNSFSLYTGKEWFLNAAGFDGLFMLQHKNPSKSFDYPNYINIVQSFSLSPTNNDQRPAKTIVVGASSKHYDFDQSKIEFQARSGSLNGYVLNGF